MSIEPHHKNAGLKGLKIIEAGFDDFSMAFATITQRARMRFEQRDWHGMRHDTLERLDLYSKIIDETVGMMHRELDPLLKRIDLWKEIRQRYLHGCNDRKNAEIACTFYNSVNRKIFTALGLDPLLTYIQRPLQNVLTLSPHIYFVTVLEEVSPQMIISIFEQYNIQTPFVDMREDARRCAVRIGHLVDSLSPCRGFPKLEMIKEPFYRGMSAYLVGRLICGEHQIPIAFVLDNEDDGVCVDALLTTADQMRVLFSFSRAYFHVNTPNTGAIVTFLKELIPQKRVAELYIGLGYHKHGKSELYLDLLSHQKVCSQDQFDYAPGKRGMVMIAFNMPNDDLIYKLIRDRFDSPKKTTTLKVMEKYDYVFKHDRAGRMLDVQTFEHLRLEDCCFTPNLLSEISTDASNAALVEKGDVLLHHTYVERRVIPLDIFLQEADPDVAESVVIDYGRAIKDLAMINVFPGDMLIKNFGVTKLGRVVFYDYDEVCPLLECNFRKLPEARHYDDELSDDPWFTIGEHDVFPEEFSAFLGLSPHLRQVFMDYHGDLLKPDYWLETQAQIKSGTLSHIRPYGNSQKLRPDRPSR